MFCFFQEWEEQAAKDKKRYDVEYKAWFEAGGEAAMKAAKKDAKAAKKGGMLKKTVVGSVNKADCFDIEASSPWRQWIDYDLDFF